MNQRSAQASAGGGVEPLPADAPLLSFDDVAAYLRTSASAVRKLIDGRAESDDGELGAALRRFVVRLSCRRRYICRKAFLGWLESQALRLDAAS